jgi:predicted amidohydrolase
MEPTLGDLTANLEQVIQLTLEAGGNGAQLVIFPELALTGYHQELLGERLVKLALSVEDEPLQRLARVAAQADVTLVVGFIQRGRIAGLVYNSLLICGSQGEVLATYAKSHLFSAENLHFRAGVALEVVSTRVGVIGPMICMDIGYPEVARILSLRGAELLIAPSAWIKEDEDIWPLLLQSRALDNLAFVAGINRVGVEGNLRFIGRSMLVNPRGHILAELGSEPGVLYAGIDLDEVIAARRQAPRFTLRRPELYAPISDLKAN